MSVATVELLDADGVMVASTETDEMSVETLSDGTWAVRLRASCYVGEQEITQVRVRREDGELQSWMELLVPARGGDVEVIAMMHMSVGRTMYQRAGVTPP